MEVRSKEFWDERYRNGQIGWDLGGPSLPLTTYLDQLVDKSCRILIPAGGYNYDAEYAFNAGFKDVHVIDVSPIALQRFSKRCTSFPKDQIHLGDFFEHEGSYDLIIEQTFFCAIDYHLRPEYARKMAELLHPGGKLVGLWFDFPLTHPDDNPPLGGSLEEYIEYFDPYFEIQTFERCYNSTVPQRAGKELFGILKRL